MSGMASESVLPSLAGIPASLTVPFDEASLTVPFDEGLEGFCAFPEVPFDGAVGSGRAKRACWACWVTTWSLREAQLSGRGGMNWRPFPNLPAPILLIMATAK